MKALTRITLSIGLLFVMFLAACASATMTPAPYAAQEQKNVPAAAPTALPMPTAAPTMAPRAADALQNAGQETTGGGGNQVTTARLIIKNGDIKLLVQDTDTAIDRTTQIVGDVGGYIVSSRVWYQDYYGTNYKYATLSIGVPVDQFEVALRRLRGIAVRVLDEQASGQDVTDEFVDLQSQLTNLQATADRIRSFLNDAKTVEEALTINAQLTDIEKQIEQVKGRMNYLSDRASYSTIAITLEPDLPVITATPTLVPSLTPTITLTPSATPWQPGKTFTSATRTLTVTYQGLTEVVIWLAVVFVPLLLPFVIVGWGVWFFFLRKKK